MPFERFGDGPHWWSLAAMGLSTVAKKYTSPNQREGTRKEGPSVLHNVQVTPQGSRRQP
jgi:hypothetical protein